MAATLLQGKADQGENAVEAVDELAIGHGEEETHHGPQMQQQQHAQQFGAAQSVQQQARERGEEQQHQQRIVKAAGRGGAHRLTGGAPLQHQESDGSSEEQTSELTSLMRITYAVFCLKKKPS